MSEAVCNKLLPFAARNQYPFGLEIREPGVAQASRNIKIWHTNESLSQWCKKTKQQLHRVAGVDIVPSLCPTQVANQEPFLWYSRAQQHFFLVVTPVNPMLSEALELAHRWQQTTVDWDKVQCTNALFPTEWLDTVQPILGHCVPCSLKEDEPNQGMQYSDNWHESTWYMQ